MKDYIAAIGSLLLAAFVWVSTKEFADPGSGLSQDPAYWPKLLTVLLVILSVMLLVNAVRAKKEIGFSVNKEVLLNVGKVFAVLIVYVFAITRIGFLVSSLVFVPGCILLFKGSFKQALLGIPIALIIYYAFTAFLKVPLPKGMFL